MAYPEFDPPVSQETLQNISSLKVCLGLAQDAALIARTNHMPGRRASEIEECARQVVKATELVLKISRALKPLAAPEKPNLHVIDGGAA